LTERVKDVSIPPMIAHRVRLVTVVSLIFWAVVAVVAVAGLVATDGVLDVVVVTISVACGVLIAVRVTGAKSSPGREPAPIARLATTAETVRAVLAWDVAILVVLIGYGLLLGDSPRPWSVLAVVAVACTLIEVVSLRGVVRAERERADVLRAQVRVLWRPDRLAWPRDAPSA
jgi:hypothetical protein